MYIYTVYSDNSDTVRTVVDGFKSKTELNSCQLPFSLYMTTSYRFCAHVLDHCYRVVYTLNVPTNGDHKPINVDSFKARTATENMNTLKGNSTYMQR